MAFDTRDIYLHKVKIQVFFLQSYGRVNSYFYLSYDVASESKLTPCNKIDKPQVVYRFTGNVMTSITTLHTYWQKYNFYVRNEISKYF